MHIRDLNQEDSKLVEQVALILQDSFRGLCVEYDHIDDARKKVIEAFGDHDISRVALDDTGEVLGWIGGIRQYNGHVYELDPLVVLKSAHGKGIGRLLIEDFQQIVRERGANTIWLGTDDENSRTTISDCDLYPNVLEQASRLANRDESNAHTFKFYEKLGFVVVGVLPDANGPGKPDIYMAKRV
jgi:aminoglycoside 6'-N-acetyltransferase I